MLLHRLRLGSLSAILVGAIALVLALAFGRSLTDSLWTRIWENALVHPDRSSFATGVVPEVARDHVVLVWRSEDGERRRTLADAEAYSGFVKRAFASLEASRSDARAAVLEAVAAEVGPIEDAAQARIEHYADWYFAWPTTYKLLYEAGRSAIRHAFAPRLISLEEAVTADVGDYLRRQYEDKVLEPEITDARLRRAFARIFALAHGRYLDALAVLEADFQAFVAQHTRHVRDRGGEIARPVEIDWQSQLRKLKTASHEKGGLGALAGAGGIASLAAAGGKAASIAYPGARAAAATRTATGGTLAVAGGGRGLGRLWTRLALPVASRATGAASAGGTGALGGALAGPAGIALGAGTGLLIDYTVNEGVELIDRDRFEGDVETAVAATFREWQDAMTDSLKASLAVWFDDTVQLLGRFERDR